MGDRAGDIEAVLSVPLSLDGEENSNNKNYRAPNIVKRILSLFTNIRPGADLTRLQLPPLFNIPKSQLQCYGELVYSNNYDLLRKCATKIDESNSALERFLCVVAWSFSTVRPLAFGVTPLNPILGETHHVSAGNLNVLLEQVSHHPPVSALHATDQTQNIETIWCHYVIPTFHGTYIEGKVHGSKVLKLLNNRETYVMNSPNLVMRLFPVPGVEWLGNVTIRCHESGLEAKLKYKGNAFFGRRSSTYRAIEGRIYMASSRKTLYEIAGHWDEMVTAKDPISGKLRVIYDAKEAIAGLKTPIVKNPKIYATSKGFAHDKLGTVYTVMGGLVAGDMPRLWTVKDTTELWASESAVVWAEVNKGIMSQSWDKAREAKTIVEEKERELVKLRASSDNTWVPKHFTLSYSKETEIWNCSPVQNWLAPQIDQLVKLLLEQDRSTSPIQIRCIAL